jgi:ubiquinone/menaquinone biosynthesis C-methylase UbiE
MKNQAKDVETIVFNGRVYKRKGLPSPVINILAKIPKNVLCLDAGCGTGRVGIWLALNSRNAIGIDISRKPLEFAKKWANEAGVSFPIIRGDIEKMPFKTKSFDAVICNFVLHHLPDCSKALEEISRVCKNDLILIEPNGSNPILRVNRVVSKILTKLLGIKWQIIACGTINETLHTPKKYVNIMEKKGFRDFKIQYVQLSDPLDKRLSLTSVINSFTNLELKVLVLLKFTPLYSNFVIIEAKKSACNTA